MNSDSGPATKSGAERMSAEQFYKQWAAPSPTSSSDPRRFTYHFAEAYAEYCIASALSSLQSKEREIEKLQRELDRETTAHFVTIDQRDSSAALVRKLAQGLRQIADHLSKHCPLCNKTTRYSGHERITNHSESCPASVAESLLSDPAVENILKTGAVQNLASPPK